MPRGKKRSTISASRRSTRSNAATPQLGTAGQPPAAPTPPSAPTDLAAFLQTIRSEVRAELDAQRVVASSLPIATHPQGPQQPVTSLPQLTGQQQPIAQTAQPSLGSLSQLTQQQQTVHQLTGQQQPIVQPLGIGTH